MALRSGAWYGLGPMNRRSGEVYSAEERDAMLRRMQATSDAFYACAVQIGCHPFIEFCGLMNEYIKACTAAHNDGIDFTQANTHSGRALPLEPYHVQYLAEKIDCIYGPSLRQAPLRSLFLRELGLLVSEDAAPAADSQRAAARPRRAQSP